MFQDACRELGCALGAVLLKDGVSAAWCSPRDTDCDRKTALLARTSPPYLHLITLLGHALLTQLVEPHGPLP